MQAAKIAPSAHLEGEELLQRIVDVRLHEGASPMDGVVTLGLIALGILLGLAFKGDGRDKTSRALTAVGVYWHFVDVVWIVVFSIVYLRQG